MQLAAPFRDLPEDDALSAGIRDRKPTPAPPQTPAATPVTPATSQGNPDPLAFSSLPEAEAVKRINTEFFVLRSSGRIYRRGPKGELTALSNQNFKTALGGRLAEVYTPKGAIGRMAADVWLASPKRREFRGMQYCPDGLGLKPGYLNLFTGWGSIKPEPGDCSLITDHICNVIAGGDSAKANFLLDWLADILQNPTRKPGVGIILRGGQGTGKSVLAAIMRRLLGSANVLTTSDKDRILGRFNAAVAGKILLVGEEMLFAGDRATTDKLKHLITGSTIQIEVKFGEPIEIDSYHRLLLTSNHHQVVQAAGEERRFVIGDVADIMRGDPKYFDLLYNVADGRDAATAAAFMQHLLDRDLSGFSPWKGQQAFAADAALARQKKLSLSPPLTWLHEIMDECADQLQPGQTVSWSDGLPLLGPGLAVAKSCKWPPRFPRRDAVEAFRAWTVKTRPFGGSEFTASPPKFWAEISKVIPLAQSNVKDGNGTRLVVIDLTDLRANFDKYFRGQSV